MNTTKFLHKCGVLLLCTYQYYGENPIKFQGKLLREADNGARPFADKKVSGG